MPDWISMLTTYLTPEKISLILRVISIILIGLLAFFLLRKGLRKIFQKSLSPQQSMLTQRIISYTLIGFFAAWILHELGFSLSILLGAAGILTVAIGFASQTSVSNIISGIFLIAEKPFVVGDIVEVEDTIGVVLSIDLLSVKIRTFDNLFVRIPNETMLKSKVKTITRFPIRRLDVKVGVAYKEDIAKVKDILFEVATFNPLCLDDPKPLFIFLGYGDSSLDMQFSVWCKREKFLELKNSIHEEIKNAFDKNRIEIPFPHRTLYTGEVTDPFPITIVKRDH